MRKVATRTAGIGAVLLAVAVLGWFGWLCALIGAGALALSGLAVTRVRPHGSELPVAVLLFGMAVVLIPGGVHFQTNDEMHGAVPILLLAGVAVTVAGFVLFVRRSIRLRRENGTNPPQ